MYHLEKTLNLVTIATPIDNNLALLDVDENVSADTLAVINSGYVNVIPILNPIKRAKYVSAGTGEQRGKARITEVSILICTIPFFSITTIDIYRLSGCESMTKVFSLYCLR